MHVAVLGAGSLGRDVAQVCATAGHDVSLHDGDANVVMDGIDAVERRLRDAVEDGTVSRSTSEAVLDRLEATTDVEAAVATADLVVETAPMDVGTVQESFAELEAFTDRSAVIASAVSDVPVTSAAAGLQHPEQAVGICFRDPVESSLVEVVVADQTSRATRDRTVAFVESIGMDAVVVRDAPGVASTRLALALEVEAMRAVEDGVASVAAVDQTMTLGYGHDVGPLERADRAGLRDRLDALETLAAEYGDRFRPPPLLADLVASGHTGKAAGEGFYVWENDRPVEPALPDPEIPRRRSRPDEPPSG